MQMITQKCNSHFLDKHISKTCKVKPMILCFYFAGFAPTCSLWVIRSFVCIFPIRRRHNSAVASCALEIASRTWSARSRGSHLCAFIHITRCSIGVCALLCHTLREKGRKSAAHGVWGSQWKRAERLCASVCSAAPSRQLGLPATPNTRIPRCCQSR